MLIDVLQLSARVYNSLARCRIRTVEELRSMTLYELRQVRGLGEKGIKEIKEKLER